MGAVLLVRPSVRRNFLVDYRCWEISEGQSTSLEASYMRIVGSRFFLFLVMIALASMAIRLTAQSKESPPAPQKDHGFSAYAAGLDCGELLRQLDTDHDSVITLNEWERFFFDHDANADTRLSSDEIQAIPQGKSGEIEQDPDTAARLAAFDRLDADKNGGIDLAEWPGNKKDFQLLDADHNRLLSREEFISRKARWWNETFENLDFDKNKIITRSEWLDSKESFDRIDRDHNGIIDRHEFYGARQ
jgi:Ca2+-binding EF-hand superfamily protein